MLDDIKKYIKDTKIDGLVARVSSNFVYWSEVERYTNNITCLSKSEKLYLYIHQIQPPICICGSSKNPKFISYSKGYREFCSSRCSAAIRAQTERRCESLIKSGGIGLANPKSLEKQQKTLNEKYGIINPGQLNDHRERMSGDDNPMKNPNVIKTCRDNYMIKYGVQNYMQIKWGDGVFEKVNDIEWLRSNLKDNNIYNLSVQLGINWTTLIKYATKYGLRVPYENSYEREIKDFLEKYGYDIKKRCKTIIYPQELDIVVENHKIAIEICGLYWHSEIASGKDKKYHYDKMIKTNEAGYRLITIFEDEWLKKQHICKSRILNAFGHTIKGKGARLLNIREIDMDAEKNFLNEYHIQGYSRSNVAYGAYDDNILVAVMSFSQPRIALGRKEGAPELLRYCTNGKNYPGVASKMFKFFIKEYKPNCVISYCDMRWGIGKLYEAIGFKEVSHTLPNYWYFLPNTMLRKHRFGFRKSVLVKTGYDPTKTEWQIMQERGYDRIWDCGNKKFIWKSDIQ